MADQQLPDAGEPNEALQDMVSDPSMETADNDDDDHAFQTTDESLHGLREISALATWTVSTHKPHCGASALLHPTPTTFWQSDGPQPHLLTAHFPRTITILKLRIYLDFSLDESYTPTKIEFFGGVHGAEYGLVMFGAWAGEEPRGWQEVGLEGQGSRGRGCVRVRVLQVRVSENHQNGKDTHVRGIQVFARDERVKVLRSSKPLAEGEGEDGDEIEDEEEEDDDNEDDDDDEEIARAGKGSKAAAAVKSMKRLYIGEEPDWMGDPEIR